MMCSMSQMIWQSAYDTMKNGVCLLSPDGTVLRCNSSMAALVEKPRESIVGAKCFDVVQCGLERIENCPAVCMLRTEGEGNMTLPNCGGKYWVAVNRLFDDDGTLAGFLHVLTDSENATSLADTDGNQASHLKAAQAAHDFRNLVQGIMGHADLAMLAHEDAEVTQECIKQIRTAAAWAAEVAEDLLSDIQGVKPLALPLNVSFLVDQVVPTFKLRVQGNTELTSELAEVPNVFGDATQIRRMVLNLLVNAMDAVPDSGGKIKVTTSLVECNSTFLNETLWGVGLPEGFYVAVEIHDTGCGMNGETLSKAFKPFFTTKGPSRGVGMAVVQKVVQRHRGTLHATSELGKGTILQVFLPVADQ